MMLKKHRFSQATITFTGWIANSTRVSLLFKKSMWMYASYGISCLWLALGATELHPAPLKAAFVYLGPPGDHGWTYSHDQSRIRVEAELKDQVQTSYIANVPESGDAERVFRTLAQQGNQVIFGTSFGYMNAMEKVAKQFPNTIFMHVTGYKSAPNMGNYSVKMYQNAYLLGVLAAKTTQSHKLGVVASFPIPEVIRNINAYTIGARSVNPKISTHVVWINSWFDPGKERDAALSLIAQKCDVLMQNTDSPAVVQAAESKGVHAFGWDSDMTKFGRNAHLAAAVIYWDNIYKKTLTDVLANTWRNTRIYHGIKEGAIDVNHLNSSIPDATRNLFYQRRAALIAETLHPFAGPLYTQSGQLFVKQGHVYSEDELSKIDFYVQGVTGSLPK